MKRFLRVVVATGLLTTGMLALAADGPHDKAIKARQAIMQLYSYQVGILGAMAKGKVDYNAELATEAANNLLAVNSLGQSTLWPPGSDSANEANLKNRALPAIWDTYPEIAEQGKSFHQAVVALADSAGNGLDALKSTIGDVGKGCKGCHDDFRTKKK